MPIFKRNRAVSPVKKKKRIQMETELIKISRKKDLKVMRYP
jgi:hypothetical protein